jgi:hypothetical protein
MPMRAGTRRIEGVNRERRKSVGVVRAATMFHQRLGNVESSGTRREVHMGEVVDLRPQVRRAPENEPGDGDGGGPTEIVIRVVFEDDEAPESEEPIEQKEPRWLRRPTKVLRFATAARKRSKDSVSYEALVRETFPPLANVR